MSGDLVIRPGQPAAIESAQRSWPASRGRAAVVAIHMIARLWIASRLFRRLQ
jgi:hypothetical protein